MNYAKIDKNDVTNGKGVCVSLWVSGCGLHCLGCHNSEIWDFTSGTPFTTNTLEEIFSALTANGVQRNFSVLGGEPLAPQNIEVVAEVIYQVRKKYPNIKIYLWTGYIFNNSFYYVEPVNPRASSKSATMSEWYQASLYGILNCIDYLIDGPYIEAERDITLKLRGSRNQHIWEKKNGDWIIKE